MLKNGNPDNKLGRPRGSQSQSTLIRNRQEACVSLLENVVRDQDADKNLRVMAASALLTTSQSAA